MKLTLTGALLLCLNAMISAEPLIVAHRGASEEAPENTIPAFELAWQQGADAIEGDFQLTVDGEIVCIHDKDTKKVSKTNKVVKQSKLEELRELDVGAWFGPVWKGTKIPTIAEVLATIPNGKKIYIEVKCGPEILPKLYQELEASGLESGQVVIISFDTEVIRSVKQDAPHYKALWLTSLKEEGSSAALEPSSLSALNTLKQLGADGLSSKAHVSLGEAYINTIRDQGLEYHVWTINDLETAKRFSEMGVRSITTNRPALLIEGLDN